ncbi:unnamed protein product [Litomosoides sigmodontis]|uniref:Uncharacterized protein n=1 Tax=Litomosoides sigmodontis TaxID=42156 RepID=A0A3P6U840_LITSI|nr:unnamed protein product [Litomosoides sigmodontis]
MIVRQIVEAVSTTTLPLGNSVSVNPAKASAQISFRRVTITFAVARVRWFARKQLDWHHLNEQYCPLQRYALGMNCVGRQAPFTFLGGPTQNCLNLFLEEFCLLSQLTQQFTANIYICQSDQLARVDLLAVLGNMSSHVSRQLQHSVLPNFARNRVITGENDEAQDTYC